MESEDLIIQFDFNAIKTVKDQLKAETDNPLISFEGSVLLHKKSKEILIEPLVETYLNLKWQSLKGWWYGYRILFFMAFGVCLTLMMSFIVEMNNHCKYEKINITSEKYWTFSDPPTLFVSINTSKTELNNKTFESKLVKRKVLFTYAIPIDWQVLTSYGAHSLFSKSNSKIIGKFQFHLSGFLEAYKLPKKKEFLRSVIGLWR